MLSKELINKIKAAEQTFKEYSIKAKNIEALEREIKLLKTDINKEREACIVALEAVKKQAEDDKQAIPLQRRVVMASTAFWKYSKDELLSILRGM